MRATSFQQNINDISVKRYIYYFIPIISLVLWGISIPLFDISHMTSLGLISIIPVIYWLSLVIIILGFCIAVQHYYTDSILMLFYIIALIFIIHGTTIFIYDAPRYAWVYKHIGMVDFIQRNGGVDTYIDAFHNWPGVFGLLAFFNDISGIDSSMDYAAWGQVAFNILNTFALLFVLKTITDNNRLIWTVLYLFLLTNWISATSYLSPQALGFFFYLIFIGIYSKIYSPKTNIDSKNIKQQVGLRILLILTFFAIIVTHQLTPIILILSISIIEILHRKASKFLPILMITLFATWIFFMAFNFMDSNSQWYENIFNLFNNILDSFSYHYESSDRTTTFFGGLFLTIFVLLLGFVGLILNKPIGYRGTFLIVLIVAPFLTVLIFSYGGEILRRIYLFTLPWIIYFVASLLSLHPKLNKFSESLKTAIISFALLIGLIFALYGNEQMYFFSKYEIDAMRYVYHTAPSGSRILLGSQNTPIKFMYYEKFNFHSITGTGRMKGIINDATNDDINSIIHLMNEDINNSYLILTNSQQAYTDLYNYVPENTLITLRENLMMSEKFDIVYKNPDAIVFSRRNRTFIER